MAGSQILSCEGVLLCVQTRVQFCVQSGPCASLFSFSFPWLPAPRRPRPRRRRHVCPHAYQRSIAHGRTDGGTQIPTPTPFAVRQRLNPTFPPTLTATSAPTGDTTAHANCLRLQSPPTTCAYADGKRPRPHSYPNTDAHGHAGSNTDTHGITNSYAAADLYADPAQPDYRVAARSMA